MKLRIVCIFLTILFLAGCSGGEGQAYTFDQVYTVMMDSEKTLHKYNILTETITSLCPDPVCTHEKASDCMFTSAMMIARVENGVCYVKDGTIFQDTATGEDMLPQSIVWYDYDKGQTEVLCTVNGTRYEGLQGRLIPTKKEVYFTVRAADDTQEAFDLWKVNKNGGEPEPVGITTDWVASGIVDGWAWYADVTGIYRVHLKNKTKEYLLQNDQGVSTAIYFFDDRGGAYCVENGADTSAILYVRAGKETVRLLEGQEIAFMQVSGDILCYSVGNALYTVSPENPEGAGGMLLYRPEGDEKLMGLWSCGLGFVAKYVHPTAGTERMVPLLRAEVS